MESEKIYFSDIYSKNNVNFIYPKQNELEQYSNEIKRYTTYEIRNSKLIDLFETLLKTVLPIQEEITVFHGIDDSLGMSVSLKKEIAIHFALVSKCNFYYKIKLPIGTKCLFFYHYSPVPYEFEIYLGKKIKLNHLLY